MAMMVQRLKVARGHVLRVAGAVLLCALVSACASRPQGYGVGAQVEREAKLQQASRDLTPDTPGMYLGLIERMQAQGLYYASLAHIDAYEKQYGVSPETRLLRADALRATDQPDASAAAYSALLNTPLAARGYRGLGLLAGSAGDFPRAAQALQQAVLLAPIDATTLSDLGYARLRSGDINGARVPLMQAAELDQSNPKIISNLALYLLAEGQRAQAQALMNEQKIADEVRAAIESEAQTVAAAHRALERAALAGGVAVAGVAGAAGAAAVRTAPVARASVPAAGAAVMAGTVASAASVSPLVSSPVSALTLAAAAPERPAAPVQTLASEHPRAAPATTGGDGGAQDQAVSQALRMLQRFSQ
ncbi:pilus assembly protein [Paraburkholderia bonniea]|nr:pilus assembly protein [Paraburkholderia bonniea]WJF91288.1 pilus assembly protein [Paraburkholderia bonniea]WJF94603.1 pilus assembly protein [Paraburkholderia bonniea]